MDAARFQPIVPDATFLVRCILCGFAHDSAAATEAEAIAKIAARHAVGHAAFLAAMPYPKGG